MMMEGAGEFLMPYLNADLINNGAATGDTAYILRIGFRMLLLAVLMLTTALFGIRFAVRGAVRMSYGIRKDVYHKILSLSFSNIDEFETGSLITRLTNDVTQVQEFTQLLMRGGCRQPVMFIGAIAMSFLLSPQMALIMLAVICVLGLVIYILVRTASPRYTKMQEAIDTLNSSIDESVTNTRVIKSFVRETDEIRRFSSVNETLVKKSLSALRVMLFMQPVSALAVNMTTLVVVWTAGRQIMVGNMPIGTLTAFITYLTQMLNSLNFMANIILRGTRAAASDRRITEVLEAKIDIRDPEAETDALPKSDDIPFSAPADPSAVPDGSVTFDHVSFRYYKNHDEKVLDDITFTINAGECIGIIGETGSGKSTLISLIPRLYEADEGTVLVGGRNVREYRLRDLRQAVSVVLQKNTLFSGTIAENLRWGNEEAPDEALWAALRYARAEEFVREFPEGLEHMLGAGGAGLSGGQRQRLTIARALLKEPKILILDDATSACDMATDAAIRRAVLSEFPGVTRLIIAQRITSVMDADRILVLSGGKVAGFAPHDVLMRNCAVYRAIFASQKDSPEEAGCMNGSAAPEDPLGREVSAC